MLPMPLLDRWARVGAHPRQWIKLIELKLLVKPGSAASSSTPCNITHIYHTVELLHALMCPYSCRQHAYTTVRLV